MSFGFCNLLKLIIVFVGVVHAEDEIRCAPHERTPPLDFGKFPGCLPNDTCIVIDVNIYENSSQHVNTNREVHEFKCLIIFNSVLHEMPTSIFATMRSNISQLFVHNVGLKVVKRVSILFGQNLEKVSMANNDIRGIHETILYDSCNLRELNLSDNQLEKFSSNAFEKLTNLEILDLSRNQIVSIPFELFQHLNRLVYLNMRHNRLQMKFGIFPENVKILDISYNNIDIHYKFKIFSFLNELETLLLHNNRIENIHFSFFKSPKLKYLGISHNLLSCNMLADIFEVMDERNIESIPEMAIRNTSNIRGIKCIE